MRPDPDPDPGTDDVLRALKALANPVRLRIMGWLEDPVGEFEAYEPLADHEAVGRTRALDAVVDAFSAIDVRPLHRRSPAEAARTA